MHSAIIDTPFSLRPTKILENADKLMEHARALYENYEHVMKPIDRTVAEDKMTMANDFRHGVEGKSWLAQAEQAKLYYNQAQEALATVKGGVLITHLFSRDVSMKRLKPGVGRKAPSYRIQHGSWLNSCVGGSRVLPSLELVTAENEDEESQLQDPRSIEGPKRTHLERAATAGLSYTGITSLYSIRTVSLIGRPAAWVLPSELSSSTATWYSSRGARYRMLLAASHGISGEVQMALAMVLASIVRFASGGRGRGRIESWADVKTAADM
ncbi:hypothetical protein H4582DRAFT_2061666 [Lactarius indigo]|nr:hypothetical protein H4582DRAFT_2061666 [Lactarius indigo]